MYTLAFDTTGSNCSVVILKDRQVLDLYSQKMDFGQSEMLLPKIKEFLDNHQLIFADLDLVGVCTGPGSFTGVRASISAARSFSIAAPDLLLSGVSAFEAYLKDFTEDELSAQNLIVVETKREDFYYQIFDQQKNKLTPPSAGSREEILSQLKKNQKVSITGDAVERFLYSPTGLNFQNIKMPSMLSVENVAACALEQADNRRVDFPKPLYLRAPDVCLR